MSGVELAAAAMEAAARGLHVLLELTDGWDSLTGEDRDAYRAMATSAIAAAAPIILAAERERIARAIEAVDPVEWALAGQHAGQDAARIARTSP